MAKRNEFERRVRELVKEHVDSLVTEITDAVRRNVAADLHNYLAGADGLVTGRGVGRNNVQRLRGMTAKKRNMTCIAPGCQNTSKGPRFHYLCEKHKDASKKDYEAWREAARKTRVTD